MYFFFSKYVYCKYNCTVKSLGKKIRQQDIDIREIFSKLISEMEINIDANAIYRRSPRMFLSSTKVIWSPEDKPYIEELVICI